MVYKVTILPVAQNDMLEIVDYVNILSKKAALQLYDDIVAGIASLSEMPDRCPLLKPTELRLKGYRAFQVKKYTVFFVVLGNTVQIRRILYSKRQFESLL